MTVTLETVGTGRRQLPVPAADDLDAVAAHTTPTMPVKPASAPASTASSGGAPVRAGLSGPGRVRQRGQWRTPLSARVARLTAAVMFTGFVAGMAVEPAPDGPDPVLPSWAMAVGLATMVVLLASWGSLAAGRRSGLWLGALAGAGLTAQTLLCPAMDPHAIAGWWWAQLGVGLGMTALTVGLLARTTPARR
jgi:hypothetical protein